MRMLHQLTLHSQSLTASASNAPLSGGGRSLAQALQSSGFWSCSSGGSYSSVSSSFGGFTTALRPPSAAVVTSASNPLRAKEKRRVVCMASAAPVEVLVKAATGHPDQLGDCPFSQRVMLTLEEKGIPYDCKFIDTSNKPAWFLEANPEGKVPVIRDDGKWVADSDVITVLLEEKFPDPPLAAPAITPGSKIFGAFIKFLKSKDTSDGSEQGLVEEFISLDAHLKENGPFLSGQKISSLDLSLAPKLYHIIIASKHYKNWSIPADLTSLNSYIEAIFARESFVKTKAPEEVVVEGWRAKATGA